MIYDSRLTAVQKYNILYGTRGKYARDKIDYSRAAEIA